MEVSFSPDATRLRCAILDGDWNALKELINCNIPLDDLDSEGVTALHRLASSNSFGNTTEKEMNTILKLLINKGANINKMNSDGNTPLHLAVKQHFSRTARELVKLGADPNDVDREGYTVLHRLLTDAKECDQNSLLIELSLKQHIDLDLRNPEGKTALQLAAENNRWRIVKLLVEKDITVSPSLHSERTYIINRFASEEGDWDKNQKVICGNIIRDNTVNISSALRIAAKRRGWKMVHYLAVKGATVIYRDDEGMSLLQRLLYEAKNEESDTVRTNILQIAIKQGLDTSERDPEGNTPVQLAARFGLWGMVDKLLSTATNISGLDSDGFPILHRCVHVQYADRRYYAQTRKRIERLMEKGVDINLLNSENETAVHIAARFCIWGIVECLLQNGANACLLDKEGMSVLHRVAAYTTYWPESKSAKSARAVFLLLVHFQETINTKDPHNNTALHTAAKNGKWDMVRELLEHGADPDIADDEGYYVLHRLAKGWNHGTCNEELLRFLLNHSKKHDVLSPDSKNVLHLAVENEHWKLVKILLNERVGLCMTDGNQRTILHAYAARRDNSYMDNDNDTELCNLMISSGAGVNVKDDEDNIALHIAIKSRKWNLVVFLLQNGSDVTLRDSEHLTVLHRLASESQWHEQFEIILDLIVKGGADLMETDCNSNTALHIAAKTGNWKMAAYFITKGVNVNTRDNDGFLPIHRLAIANLRIHLPAANDDQTATNLKITDTIVNACINPNETDSSGNSALQLAAKHDNWELFKRLLPFAIDVNDTDSDGFTVLHRIASNCPRDVRTDIMLELFEKGVENVNMPCPHGDSALQIAAKRHNWNTVEKLLDMGAVISPCDSEGYSLLHHLANSHLDCDLQLNLLQRLVSSGVDINALDPNCRSVLESAADNGQWNLVRVLINNGAIVQPVLLKGETYFHLLAKSCNFASDEDLISIVKLLLMHHVDINRRNNEGDTPLHVAFYSRYRSLLKTLADNGADPSLPGRNDYSVFHMICANYRTLTCILDTQTILEVLTLFASRGLNINLRAKDGKLGLSIAIQNEHWIIFQHLVALGAHYTMSAEVSYQILENLHLFPQSTTNMNRLYSFVTYVMSTLPKKKNGGRQRKVVKRQKANDALWRCISTGNFFMAETLIRCGAEVVIQSRYPFRTDSILLTMVEQYKHDSHDQWISCLDALLSKGVEINGRYGGKTALEYIFKLPHKISRDSVKESLIAALMERGADPLFTDENGHSLLRLVVDKCTQNYTQSIPNMVKYVINLGLTTHQTRFTSTTVPLLSFGYFPVTSPNITSPNVTSTNITSPNITSPNVTSTNITSPNVTSTNIMSPTELMLKKRNIFLLKLLIESGACSNHELWHLHELYEMPLLQEAEKDVRAGNLLQIVRNAACAPRSLKSLCRLAISHAIGIGLQRTTRVESLPLPQSLQSYILFADLVSLDYET